MSVEIKGIKEIQAKLEKMLPARQSSSAINKAVNVGGDKVVENLKTALSSFKDTGASEKEVVRSNARANSLNDDRSLKVGWNGPKSRKSLVHLAEFGYSKGGKKIAPQGKGAIQRAVTESEKDYFSILYDELRRVFNG